MAANPANDPNYIWELLDRMEAVPEVRDAVHQMFYRGDLSFLLHDGQLKMRDVVKGSNADECLVFCSRQIGKSFFVITECLEHTITKRTLARVFSHTIDQIDDIVSDNLSIIQQLAPPGLIQRKKSDKRWRIANTELRLGPLAKAHVDGKRGGNAGIIILEEGGFTASDEYQAAIGSVINPQLLRSGGKLVHVSTPSKNANHYLHHSVLPKCEANGALARLDIYENPQLTPAQIEKAKKRCTTPQEWEREYLVKIVRDEISSVVPEFDDRHVFAMSAPAYTHWLTALDFGGVRDKHALLLCFYDFERAKFCVWDERFLPINTPTKEIIAAGLDLEKSAKWLDDRPYRVSDCPGQIVVDLRNEGYRVITPDKEPGSWEAGINSIRMAFMRDEIEIHPRCKNLILSLKYGQYTENRKDFQRTEQFGHLDLISALIYGFRKAITFNPFPKNLGKSRITHHLSKQEEENQSVLESAFKNR